MALLCHNGKQHSLFVLLASAIFFTHIYAYLVVPGSSCTHICTDNEETSLGDPSLSSTTTADVVCLDSDYSSTDTGRKFEDCVSCQLTSHTFNHGTNQTDFGWSLYNIRYTISTCVYGRPNRLARTDSNICQNECSAIQSSIVSNLGTPGRTTKFAFCSSQFLSSVDECASCYAVVNDRLFISNFFYTLKTACQTRPDASHPFILQPSQIFTNHPPPNFLVPSTARKSSGLDRSVKIALAVCIPLFFFLFLGFIITLCFIRRLRLKRELHNSPLKLVRRPTDSFPPARRPRDGPHNNIPSLRPSQEQELQRRTNILTTVGEGSVEQFELSQLQSRCHVDDPGIPTDSQTLLRPSLPQGLESWERHGVLQAAAEAIPGRSKSVRFSHHARPPQGRSSHARSSGSTPIFQPTAPPPVASNRPSPTALAETPTGSGRSWNSLTRNPGGGGPVFREVEYLPGQMGKRSPSKSPRERG